MQGSTVKLKLRACSVYIGQALFFLAPGYGEVWDEDAEIRCAGGISWDLKRWVKGHLAHMSSGADDTVLCGFIVRLKE